MDFREITFGDRNIFDKFGYICSDYCFSYIYMYNELYKLKVAEKKETVIIRSDLDAACFYMPLGDIKQGIAAVLKYCEENNTSPHSKIPEAYSGIFENCGFLWKRIGTLLIIFSIARISSDMKEKDSEIKETIYPVI